MERWLRRIRRDAPPVFESLYMPFAFIVDTCMKECSRAEFREPAMQDIYEEALRQISFMIKNMSRFEK